MGRRTSHFYFFRPFTVERTRNKWPVVRIHAQLPVELAREYFAANADFANHLSIEPPSPEPGDTLIDTHLLSGCAPVSYTALSAFSRSSLHPLALFPTPSPLPTVIPYPRVPCFSIYPPTQPLLVPFFRAAKRRSVAIKTPSVDSRSRVLPPVLAFSVPHLPSSDTPFLSASMCLSLGRARCSVSKLIFESIDHRASTPSDKYLIKRRGNAWD